MSKAAVIFDIKGAPGGYTVRRWEVVLPVYPVRRYVEVATFGLYATRDEADKAAKKANRDYKIQTKGPAAPFRVIVSYDERGNYGDTILHLECKHSVVRKGGWYISEADHRRKMARGEIYDPSAPLVPDEKIHRARCEKCLKEGKSQ